MVYILHIDTSAHTGLVMLAGDGKEIISRLNETERDHAGSINRMVAEVITEAGISLADLNGIAICSGPGSYTGLRIGMATAKGFSYALNKPLIVNSKLELLVDRFSNNEDYIFSVFPARQGEYFMSLYHDNKELIKPSHLSTEMLNNILSTYKKSFIAGKIEEDVNLDSDQQYVPNENVLRSVWASISYNNWVLGTFADVASTEPLYLKQVFIQQKNQVDSI